MNTTHSSMPDSAGPGAGVGPVELSIVMPCLNEERSLGLCLRKSRDFLERTGIRGEILVADNGSTDRSIEIARAAGARVVNVATRGYGSALKGGIAAANGTFVIMGDSDDSYDFSQLDAFVDAMRDGADVVMGNRFRGGIVAGAMPALHQYFGNPLITYVGRRFFGGDCRDFYCGLRGFRKSSVEKLQLQSPGMEFALEMLVKATMHGMNVREVPTTLSPDQRGRPPHLRRWRDGWRSIKFFLLFSPKWLFWYPGLALIVVGLLGMLAFTLATPSSAPMVVARPALLGFAAAALLGCQTCILAICGKQVAVQTRLHPPNVKVDRWIRFFSLEKALVSGALLGTLGMLGCVLGILGIGRAAPIPQLLVPSMALTVLGTQVVSGRFFLSLLQLCGTADPPLPS